VEASATTAFLIGDPPFADDQLAANQEPRGGSGPNGFAPLPMTREEVETVASIFTHATSLLGPAASEAAVGQLADSDGFREFGTIHIATHAVVDDRRPWKSALVLSQVDLPDPLDATIEGHRLYDGMVTAEEVLREWKLAADLVTLSACETGLGRAAGGEGYLGFAHAFLQTGARSVLVSLWRVDDRSTALLMRRFYRNRYGSEYGADKEPAMTKAAALHEAKVWLRSYEDEYGRRPYAHPYYWAPFILIGDPG
jgi:CHAT domain-containing protein